MGNHTMRRDNGGDRRIPVVTIALVLAALAIGMGLAVFNQPFPDIWKSPTQMQRSGDVVRTTTAMTPEMQEAEREVCDIKKAEFMEDKVGGEFNGIISSVTSFGFFVELENSVEGLVRVADLDDDYYVYDEQHLMLLGQRNKKVYRLGDSVKVKCSRVDIDNREVFFDILDSEQNLEEIVPSEETASIIAEVKKEFGTKPEEIENTETTTEPEEEFNE